MNPGTSLIQSIKYLLGTYPCSTVLGAKGNAKGALQRMLEMSVCAISLSPVRGHAGEFL